MNTEKTLLETESQSSCLDIDTVSGNFYGISEMCKRCSGDGWVFHSKVDW